MLPKPRSHEERYHEAMIALYDAASTKKKVKVRKPQRCGFGSWSSNGQEIRPGDEVLKITVFPTDPEAGVVGIRKPKAFYFCQRCVDCTH